MKRILIALFVTLALAGCASLDNAGFDSYTVRSFKADNGKVACCELEVKSGKEYADRAVQFQTTGAGAGLVISETGSKAVKSQALAVKALTVLPVTGLDELLK
jgi:hypothetical protein